MISLPPNIWLNIAFLVVSFVLLSKSADFLVDGAVGIAHLLKIPKMVIGIVLLGFATTAPEFTVTMISALKGHVEVALGNALGSVIVDDAVALALGIIMAPSVIRIPSKILKSVGLFLIAIDLIAFIMSFNGMLSRWEGMILLILLLGYLFVMLRSQQKQRVEHSSGTSAQEALNPEDNTLELEIIEHIKPGGLGKQALWFFLGLIGVLLASELLIESALNIAHLLKVPEVVIGLTIIAFGTSLPEIATCVVAARKGHGDLAFGDIIGADILNILWIIGAAATVKPFMVEKKVIFFSFPWMIVVVLSMLGMARLGYKLQKWKGVVLLILFALYLSSTIFLFYTPMGKKLF